jgi:hypothetical protein
VETGSELQTGTTGFDVQSYQRFWENVGSDVLKRHEGQFVALKRCANGWQIIETSDDLDDLLNLLTTSGVDVGQLVFDRVHREEATAAGVELQ